MPLKLAKTPTEKSLDALAEITPSDIEDAKRIAARDAPQAVPFLNATRIDRSASKPIPDSEA